MPWTAAATYLPNYTASQPGRP